MHNLICFNYLSVPKAEKNEKSSYLSGCPAPYYHYPHEQDGFYVCAYWWNGEGDDWPDDACNGIR